MRALGALCQESEAETNTYFFYYFTTTIPTKLLLPNSQIYLQAVKAQSSIPRCLLFDFHPPHYRVIHLTSGKPLSPAFPLISLAIFFFLSLLLALPLLPNILTLIYSCVEPSDHFSSLSTLGPWMISSSFMALYITYMLIIPKFITLAWTSPLNLRFTHPNTYSVTSLRHLIGI